MPDIVIDSVGPEQTEAFASRLASRLSSGTRLLLGGPLGAGKTTFTRGLVRGLGHSDPREVASPTFALHHRYEGGRLTVDHLDLYRIEDASAAERQGLLDPLAEPDGVVVVEWWERLGAPHPEALVVSIDLLGEFDRRLVLSVPDSSAGTFSGLGENA